MTKATEADFQMIRSLRLAGVLKNMNRDCIPDERGTIIISCADGDRITDILTHHWNICDGHQCHHTFSLNGGPLLIPKDSPIAHYDEGKILLAHILDAHKLKKITTVTAYGHWPCGAAITSHVSLTETLDLLFQAKGNTRRYLQSHGLEPSVIAFLHVDYGNKKKSYFFDRNSYLAWKTKALPAKPSTA